MSKSPASRRALVALSIALGASLLVIAFLLGRESARIAPPEPPVAEAEPAPQALEPEIALMVEEPEPERWPTWVDPDDTPKTTEQEPYDFESFGARIERRPDGTLLLSNRRPAGAATSQPPTSSPVAAQRPTSSPSAAAPIADAPIADVPTYFAKMDAIQSEGGEGDPNAFAMKLIRASMKGSTSGFDDLIGDSERMEGEIRAITPPPSCAGYHEGTLQALADSRALLEDLKSGIQQGDIQKLTGITEQASALQATARSLEAMRKQILTESQR